MEHIKLHIQQLYNKWTEKTATPEEIDELFTLLENNDIDGVLDSSFKLMWQKEPPNDLEVDRRHQAILVSIMDQYPSKQFSIKTAHRVHFLRTAWFHYAAAIILVLGTALYFLTSKQKIEKPVVATADAMPNKEPGMDKAVLTLSDGRKVVLENSNSENISDGSISIQKSNGTLTYNTALTSENGIVSFNTMVTPRGGQYQLVLPDGSKVWMNSASSLKYPTVFSGKERTVELSGEAYFEVKSNKKRPFVVKTQKAEVLVLGTSFNINSFEDEPQFSATLISGSVKVKAGESAKIISPGQQAKLSNFRPNIFEIKDNVDINQVIAWQKGKFEFKEVALDVIARQLSRWYDVDVIVGVDNKKINFSGGISKKTPLKTVLEIFESNGVKNRWDNNVITLNSN